MKYLFVLMMVISCNNTNTENKADIKAAMDTTLYNSMMRDAANKTSTDPIFDTTGTYKSPVQIIGVKILRDEYTNYKNIRLTYKNVSGKKISSTRFHWYGYNAFNEPADMGSIISGLGSGFDDEEMNNKTVKSGKWDILSKDVKIIKLAWAYEVAFSDGTIWRLNNN